MENANKLQLVNIYTDIIMIYLYWNHLWSWPIPAWASGSWIFF